MPPTGYSAAMQTLLSRSEEETARIAAGLAGNLQSGDIILLRGNLGSGKTVFARALVRALAGDPGLEVPSPTFTLVQTYDTAAGALWHFDFYRLKDPEEIYELGWEEALAGGIVLAEWPERLGSLVPPAYLDIHIAEVDNEPEWRRIAIERIGDGNA